MAQIHFLSYQNDHVEVILDSSLSRSYIENKIKDKDPRSYFCVSVQVTGPGAEELDKFLKENGLGK